MSLPIPIKSPSLQLDILPGFPRCETKVMKNKTMDIYVGFINFLLKLSPNFSDVNFGLRSKGGIKCHIIAPPYSMSLMLTLQKLILKDYSSVTHFISFYIDLISSDRSKTPKKEGM